MILTWIQFFYIDFRWCEGSGASFHCLRMRSRSTRKCAHMNAGDLGSILADCARACDPIHVTAQGKSTGPNCPCVLPPRTYVPSYECVCSLLHAKHPARWLVERGHLNKVMTYPMLMSHVTPKNNTPIVFLALWLVRTQTSHIDYSCTCTCTSELPCLIMTCGGTFGSLSWPVRLK